jgi:hypothetical protein
MVWRLTSGVGVGEGVGDGDRVTSTSGFVADGEALGEALPEAENAEVCAVVDGAGGNL